MQSKLENLSEAQDGARFLMEADCGDTHITVVTAYDGSYDDWPYHVYLQNGDKPRQRLTERPTTRRGATKLSALEQGLLLAMNALTRRPKELKSLSRTAEEHADH